MRQRGSGSAGINLNSQRWFGQSSLFLSTGSGPCTRKSGMKTLRFVLWRGVGDGRFYWVSRDAEVSNRIEGSAGLCKDKRPLEVRKVPENHGCAHMRVRFRALWNHLTMDLDMCKLCCSLSSTSSPYCASLVPNRAEVTDSVCSSTELLNAIEVHLGVVRLHISYYAF